MCKVLSEEPVALQSAIIAVFNSFESLGIVHLTTPQVTGINIALAAVLGLFVRASVVPVVKVHPVTP